MKYLKCTFACCVCLCQYAQECSVEKGDDEGTVVKVDIGREW